MTIIASNGLTCESVTQLSAPVGDQPAGSTTLLEDFSEAYERAMHRMFPGLRLREVAR